MFSVLLVSNPSTLLDHTEARKAEKCFFFLRPPTPFISGSGWPGPPYLKAWSATDNKVSLYRGSFTYMLLLLGWRRSFVIPRTLLYRCSLYRGSSVWGHLVKVNKLCQSLGPSVPRLQSLYAGSNVIQQIFGNQKILTPHYHDVSRQSIYFHFCCFREFILYHFYKTSYYTN